MEKLITGTSGHVKAMLKGLSITKSLCAITAFSLLAGCGGGGGGNKTTSYQVNAAAGTGGTITPASQSITENTTSTLSVSASSGYTIDKVTGCGGSLSGGTYTTGSITANCVVVATFSPIVPITVTATAGTGGSITPASQNLASGTTTTVTVTPNSGYNIDQVTGCGGTLAGSTYTTGAVTSSCAVIATFTPATPTPVITVSAVAGTGGSITPASQTVANGASTTATITPANGYTIAEVIGCGGSLAGNTYTTGALSSSCTIIATFSPASVVQPLVVNAVASNGGSITPASQEVANGAATTLTVTPNSGYTIDQVSGCGGSLVGNSYTTAAIASNCTVVAIFSPIAPIVVSAAAGTGGSITPASQTVASGASTAVTITPDTGYSIDKVSGCGGTLNGNTYTTGTITENCTISASFTAITITANAGTGGTITPATQNVTSGATAALTVTANSGYNINQVTGCGGSLVGNTYTTSPVTSSCTISASFTPKVTVTATAGANGTISPGTRSINPGANTTFTITPNGGFAINTVTGCGGSLAGSTYTTASLYANCTVNATFVTGRTATASAGTGGTILPASRTVANGTTTTFTVTPSSGYIVDTISGCGGSISGNTYTTDTLGANCSITVSFRTIPVIFAGGSHTCALNDDASAAKCWGQNSSGQLGVASYSLTAHGDESGENPASAPEVTLPDSDLTYNFMELGTQHSCAILSDHNLYCWGENQNGQLGIGTNADIKVMNTTPIDLEGQDVLEVSAGGQFTCARLGNGEVHCWGLNSSGELGVGDASTRFVPAGAVALSGTPVQLAAGSAHICARLANQSVQCWGDNSSGQLGDSDGGNDSATPSSVNLGGPTAITDLASGGLFSCVIVDGNVKCWGENGSGQLGNNDGTNTDLDVPSAALDLNGETPSKLALGGEHGCVLTSIGHVYCWGESDAGQTGQNDVVDDIAPALVDFGAYTVTAIAAGGDHTCVKLLPDDNMDTTRPVRCWGEGGVGQLGLEDTSDIGDNEVIDNTSFDLLLWP